MSTMGHIDDQAAASALGALTPDEQRQVDEHRAICPTCDQLLQKAEESAHLLALAVPATPPPRRCKTVIMQRIENDLFLRQPTPKRGRVPAWSGWAVAGVVMLLMMTWNMQLRQQLSQANMVGSMLVAGPESRTLVAQDQEHKSMTARMYMVPSSNYALLVLHNFEPAPEGKVYRVWVANETEKSSISAFHAVDERQPMVVHPPEPITQYKWIMITIEDADEGASPDAETTILRGDL